MNFKAFIIGIGVIAVIVLLALSYFYYAEILRNMINPLLYLGLILISIIIISLLGIEFSKRYSFSNYDRLRIRMMIIMVAIFVSPPLVLFLNSVNISSESTVVDFDAVTAIHQSRFGAIPGTQEQKPDFYQYMVNINNEDIVVFSNVELITENRDLSLIVNTGLLGVAYYELK